MPFLKIDKGLEDEADGVQMLKPIPGLDALLARAKAKGVFGTKERSVIKQNNAAGILTTEAPINVSNVQLVVKVDGKDVVTRVGYERQEVTKRRPDGTEYSATRSVRIARKTGKEI